MSYSSTFGLANTPSPFMQEGLANVIAHPENVSTSDLLAVVEAMRHKIWTQGSPVTEYFCETILIQNVNGLVDGHFEQRPIFLQLCSENEKIRDAFVVALNNR